MKKKHAASEESNLTMCGYACTDAEYKKMRGRRAAYVNCKRCIEVQDG